MSTTDLRLVRILAVLAISKNVIGGANFLTVLISDLRVCAARLETLVVTQNLVNYLKESYSGRNDLQEFKDMFAGSKLQNQCCLT